ncbi:MAG TPA: hypothetical protein VGC51_13660 [Hansschlegelia sp.]
MSARSAGAARVSFPEDSEPSAPVARRNVVLPAISDYLFDFRPGENARELIVVFSPSKRFILYRHRFPCDALFVCDQRGLYYLDQAARLARALVATIESGGYERTLFLGTSKGAFGALLLARLCAGLRPRRTFRALAFSPQVQLDPANTNLYFPSYRRLRSIARKRFAIAAALTRYGDASLAGRTPNLHATVVYALHNRTDAVEADRMSGPNLSKLPIDGSSHGSILYLLLKGQPEAYVRTRVAKVYARRRRRGVEEDYDLQASKPKDPEQLVREIVGASDEAPTLEALIDRAMAADPHPLPAHARLAAGARRTGGALKVAAVAPRFLVRKAATLAGRLKRVKSSSAALAKS